ncbi:MAG TPA: ABC transporter ATP-binding protein [Acidimicrobiia bacterium]|nr:ABC transporter ATP-binding protein [Acidimicrobiia bacterium]
MNGPILACRRLEKSFEQTPALRGVDLDVRQGEILAITGPSGSGKSTLLHCLAGIQLPDGGEVTYQGTRIDQLGQRERTLVRRRHFGFVFQFGSLVPDLTVAENVALPLLLDGTDRRSAFASAGAWLDRIGVGDLVDRSPAELSGGQRQRVAVARALVHEPSMVFADEPTGALDSLSSEALLEVLVGLVDSTGLTLILVTHDPRVAAYSMREMTIRDGVSTSPTSRT